MITTTQLIDEIRISNDKIIRLIKGDITDQNVDVIAILLTLI